MKRRYSSNDKHFGPFTFSKHSSDGWCPFGVVLDSGGREDRDGGCNLKFHAFGYTLICELPQIVQPHRIKHVAQGWNVADIERMGRNWYYETFTNEYGFTVSDGFLQIFLGAQTHDSSTNKSWCKHLPWTQWRFIRQSWYGNDGQHIETLWASSSPEVRRAQSDWRYEFKKTLAKRRFKCIDYDGKEIIASTHIEEREWRFGQGLFKWLSIFRKPKIRRDLSLSFDSEVGPEKGSWKGGTLGHGIEMLPGELHEDAFRRYCEQEHRSKSGGFRLEFVSAVDALGNKEG